MTMTTCCVWRTDGIIKFSFLMAYNNKMVRLSTTVRVLFLVAFIFAGACLWKRQRASIQVLPATSQSHIIIIILMLSEQSINTNWPRARLMRAAHIHHIHIFWAHSIHLCYFVLHTISEMEECFRIRLDGKVFVSYFMNRRQNKRFPKTKQWMQIHKNERLTRDH